MRKPVTVILKTSNARTTRITSAARETAIRIHDKIDTSLGCSLILAPCDDVRPAALDPSIVSQEPRVIQPKIEILGVYWVYVRCGEAQQRQSREGMLEEPQVYGAGDGLCTALDIQLLEDVVEVRFDGAQR